MENPWLFSLAAFLTAILGSSLGSLVGLGGGFVIVPVLALFLHVPLKLAVGTGLISVICSSSNAGALLLRNQVPNLRVASFLEVGTTAGALTGILLVGFLSPETLYLIFAAVLFYSAYSMHSLRRGSKTELTPNQPAPSSWSRKLGLNGSWYDALSGQTVSYQVQQPLIGLSGMYAAGILSALLGVGSGVLKVPAMDRTMRLPIKVSSATSNIMVGVTTTGSAIAYLRMGLVPPLLVAPVTAGVLIGSWLGSRFLLRMSPERIRNLFILILLVLGSQMLWRGTR